MKGIRQSALVLLIFILFPSLALSSDDVSLKKVKLAIQWLPQGQFAGYFVGVDKGYYKKYGIDLEIISGGPDTSP
ncbi:MAG: ABC transporter substrate-binding protein, partial [Thermodesulfovibrionales bacterium]